MNQTELMAALTALASQPASPELTPSEVLDKFIEWTRASEAKGDCHPYIGEHMRLNAGVVKALLPKLVVPAEIHDKVVERAIASIMGLGAMLHMAMTGLPNDE